MATLLHEWRNPAFGVASPRVHDGQMRTMLGKSSPDLGLNQAPRFHQMRPDTLQFAIAFVSVFGSKSFELGFTFALFFGDPSGCRPGFEISWLRVVSVIALQVWYSQRHPVRRVRRVCLSGMLIRH